MAVQNPATEQDTISALVQVKLMKNSVIAQSLYDVSDQAEPGSKSITFYRRAGAFTVEKLTGSTEGTEQTVSYSPDQLDLDQEAHIQWVIKKFDTIRNKIQVLNNALEDATEAHADSLDSDCVTEMVVGIDALNDLTGAFTQDKVVDMITRANKSRMPRRNRVFAFGNDAEGVLKKIDGFIDASKSNMDIARNGQIGILYGTPVLMSDALADAEGFLYHPQCCALGFGARPAVEDQKAITFGTGSRRWVMDQLYGVKALNAGKLIVKCSGV